MGAYAALGALLAHLRLPSAARVVNRHVRTAAERTGHHPTIVYAKLVQATSLEFEGDCVRSEQLLQEVLREQARWLQPGEYVRGMVGLLVGLSLRGRLLEQVAWLEDARWHSSAAGKDEAVSGLDFLGIALAGLLEHPSAGLELITKVHERLAESKPSRGTPATRRR